MVVLKSKSKKPVKSSLLQIHPKPSSGDPADILSTLVLDSD